MNENQSRSTNLNVEPKRRILIVDDEPAVVRLVAEILRDGGYSCLGCHSGLEALELINTQVFDAVLSDVHMPGMGGMELLRLLREEHPHIAFIIITGEGDIRVGVQAMKEGAGDYVLKPLNFGAVLMSVKQVLERKQMEEKLEEYRLRLEQMVEQRTLQLRQALSRIENTYDETLQALATALELRDDGTAGHSHRVMTYAMEIAAVMGCSNDQMRSITMAALLHDMGKIGIPDAILMKTTPLTPGEREVMETHVVKGYNQLNCNAFLSGAAEIVLTHHERFDGKGYPQGLVASEIPLGARIFAVADNLNALTSDRPHRRGSSLDAVRDRIMRQSGKKFDPQVVSAFMSIDLEHWEEIRSGAVRAKSWWNADAEVVPAPSLHETLHFLAAKG